MFEPTALAVFLSATLALLIVPGPAVLYIVARSLRQGRLAGLVSVWGIALGAAFHVLFAALGLSAILMQSALAFGTVKYLGAGYLVFLGIRTFLSKPEPAEARVIQTDSYRRIFYQGFIVNLLNPKTALFFLSFLPQFVDPSRGPVVLQVLTLGMIFIVMAIISDSLYALAAGSAGHFLTGSLKAARFQKFFSGSIYIGLGLSAALSPNLSGD